MATNENKSLPDHDGLRLPQHVCDADPRNHLFVKADPETGKSQPLSQADQYGAVAIYTLSEVVAESVRILFDTARNLYLYAWFVYRFYNIAEQQVFACLEMALRERLKNEMPLPEAYWLKNKRSQAPSLRPMLRYVIDMGYIRNEDFRIWRERGIVRSRQRYEMEKLQEMKKQGLNSIELDYSKVVVKEEDLENYDYLDVLLIHIPNVRNNYAHGSGLLHNQVLHSFEVVSEFINKLFLNVQDSGQRTK